MIGATDITPREFRDDSVFRCLYETDAKLVFFGVGFAFCMFLYLMEQRMRVPNRYAKEVRGDVVADGSRTAVSACHFLTRGRASVHAA